MSSEFLDMSLLRELERGFIKQIKEAEKMSDVDRGLDMIGSLKEEVDRPLDDRKAFLRDIELAALMSMVKNQMTTGPQKRKFARQAATAIRRIIVEEFPESYWSNLSSF